jgi:hypothetical protein
MKCFEILNLLWGNGSHSEIEISGCDRGCSGAFVGVGQASGRGDWGRKRNKSMAGDHMLVAEREDEGSVGRLLEEKV